MELLLDVQDDQNSISADGFDAEIEAEVKRLIRENSGARDDVVSKGGTMSWTSSWNWLKKHDAAMVTIAIFLIVATVGFARNWFSNLEKIDDLSENVKMLQSYHHPQSGIEGKLVRIEANLSGFKEAFTRVEGQAKRLSADIRVVTDELHKADLGRQALGNKIGEVFTDLDNKIDKTRSELSVEIKNATSKVGELESQNIAYWSSTKLIARKAGYVITENEKWLITAEGKELLGKELRRITHGILSSISRPSSSKELSSKNEAVFIGKLLQQIEHKEKTKKFFQLVAIQKNVTQEELVGTMLAYAHMEVADGTIMTGK